MTVGSVPPAAVLSFEEETKHRLPPLDAYPRLLDCVSANRPPDLADRFRFRWFGLFYQAPAQDCFTTRVRLPGGRLQPFQLAGLAEITQRHASGQVVLNAQGGLDLPGVPLTSAIEVLRELENVGLSARRTGGDCVQSIRGGEYDGFEPVGNGAPIYPLVCALEQAVAHGPVFADLPGPCEIVFQTVDAASLDPDPSMNTLTLWGAADDRSPAGENLEPSQRTSFLLPLPGEPKSGLLLSRERVVSGCLELLKAWAAGADRSSREEASLTRFLNGIDPESGPAFFGDAKRVLLPSRARSEIPAVRNGWPAGGLAIVGGCLLSGQLAALERCCRERNWQEIRLARGHAYPVGIDGAMVETDAALTRALTT